ncbi:hypothetical protein Leryth_015586 [Lithospermum erythrorhizon]|nr:hypothetical protein Leryth_015586 [Lithospermum erythrorhizon]
MLLNNEKTNLPPPKFLQIKQEDKTFASLLSKDQASEIINHQRGESSFRVMYYGGATGSIPFLWESQPGTPKHALFCDTSYSLPPLTPPPSYQSCPKMNVTKSQQKGDINITTLTSSKSKLLNTIMSKFAMSSRKPKITPFASSKCELLNTIFSKLTISSRKSNITPISSSNYSLSSSCSNSSSSYSFTSNKNSLPRSKTPIYFGLENDDNNDNDHEYQQELTRSSSRTLLCFGSRNKNRGGSRRSRGRHQIEKKSLRKGLLSIFASHGTV